jgi:hypothetical protein
VDVYAGSRSQKNPYHLGMAFSGGPGKGGFPVFISYVRIGASLQQSLYFNKVILLYHSKESLIDGRPCKSLVWDRAAGEEEKSEKEKNQMIEDF